MLDLFFQQLDFVRSEIEEPIDAGVRTGFTRPGYDELRRNRIEVGHIDARRGVLRVINGKGGKHREVPISPEMVDRLREFWKLHRNPKYLFPGIGRAWKEKYGEAKLALKDSTKPMSDSSVQKAMRMCIITSRLTKPGISCHVLRSEWQVARLPIVEGFEKLSHPLRRERCRRYVIVPVRRAPRRWHRRDS